MTQLLCTIASLLFLLSSAFASYSVYYTDVTTSNSDGTITVTPTLEIVGIDDISD